jgi:hypothetical protein
MDKRIGSGNEFEVEYTDYDRLLRAWENSMEMVRDLEMYKKRTGDDKLKDIYGKFAEEEGKHAAEFRCLLKDYHNKR